MDARQSDETYLSRGYGQGAIEPGERPAVLSVDLQLAFTDPAFPMGGGEMVERAVQGTARVLAAARAAGVPVLHSYVAYREDGADLGLWATKVPVLGQVTEGSRWARVDPRLLDERDIVLRKQWPSFFHGTPLGSILAADRRDTVIICGCTTSGCVRATTVDAFSGGLRTLVPEDCVGDQSADAHDANLRDVQRRYAEVTTADAVIAYLERVASPATV